MPPYFLTVRYLKVSLGDDYCDAVIDYLHPFEAQSHVFYETDLLTVAEILVELFDDPHIRVIVNSEKIDLCKRVLYREGLDVLERMAACAGGPGILADAHLPHDRRSIHVWNDYERARQWEPLVHNELGLDEKVGEQQLSPGKPAETDSDVSLAAEPDNIDTSDSEGVESQPENVFRKTGDFWTVGFQGMTAVIKHSKGMSYIRQLLDKPNQLISVNELANPKSDTRLSHRSNVVDEGSVLEGSDEPQDLLDKDYLKTCNDRLKVIKGELHKAEDDEDTAAKERLERERDQIHDLLKPALKLSGKSRRFSDDLEKARVAVAMAVIRALKNINEHHPSLHQHLDNFIHRG